MASMRMFTVVNHSKAPLMGISKRGLSSGKPTSGGAVNFVLREIVILSSIAGSLTLTLCVGGYIFNQIKESEERAKVRLAPEPIGKYIALEDGRKFHVSDMQNGGNITTQTIIFESCQGETLIEFEQVANSIMKKAPSGTRCIAYSRSGLGLSDPQSPPSFITLMRAALMSSSYLTSSNGTASSRSSSSIAADLRQVMRTLNVSGPVVLVGSGIGALHTRVMASELKHHFPEAQLAGLVFIEPIVEGTAEEHASINPAFSLEQRWWTSFWTCFFVQVGFMRLGSVVSKAAKKRANALYGDNSGEAVLQQTILQSHALTVLQEVEAWQQCEGEAEEAEIRCSSPTPALILTRGRKGALFNSAEIDGASVLESAWDKGLSRLHHRLCEDNFDTCLVAVDGGGLRLPLYRPEAVATAVQLVASKNNDESSNQKTPSDSSGDSLKEALTNLGKVADSDAPEGVLQFNILK